MVEGGLRNPATVRYDPRGFCTPDLQPQAWNCACRWFAMFELHWRAGGKGVFSLHCFALQLCIWIPCPEDLVCADLGAARYNSTSKGLFFPQHSALCRKKGWVRGVLGLLLASDVGLQKQMYPWGFSMVRTFFSTTKWVINVLIWGWALCRKFMCTKPPSFFLKATGSPPPPPND